MSKKTPDLDTPFFDIPPGAKITPLSGGRNSQVFLVQPRVSEPLIFKRYFKNPADNRDRQGIEAMALRFFEEVGIESVPRLLNMDRERQISILSYIEGTKITHPTNQDISLAAQFLLKLNRPFSTKKAMKEGFPPASEAFFSAMDILKNIEMRLTRLENVAEECPLHRELSNFLRHELCPAYAQYADGCCKSLQGQRIGIEEYIPNSWHILSPSDFGMHNALKGQDGHLYFLDFEYFGWDDPAKILADFCLHPAMNLSETLKHRFLSSVLPALSTPKYDDQRAVALFPLFGIKWCCILLNEFLVSERSRREFSGYEVENEKTMLVRQLKKSHHMLEQLPNKTKYFEQQIIQTK